MMNYIKKSLIIIGLLVGFSGVSLYAMEDPRDIKHGAKETEQSPGQKKKEPEVRKTKVSLPIIKRNKIESPKSLKDLSLTVARKNYFTRLQNSKKISHRTNEKGEKIFEYEKLPFIEHFNKITEDLKEEVLQGNYGETFLHSISSMQDLENLRLMGVLKPEYINLKNNNGQTVINALLDRGHCEIVQYLLEEFGNELDISSADKHGIYPFQNAIFNENANLAAQIAQILHEQKKPLFESSILQHIIDKNLFELLPLVTIISRTVTGFDTQFYYKYALDNEQIQSALYLGIYNLADDLQIKELISKGADINAFYYIKLGNNKITDVTMLMIAALKNKCAAIDLCIKNGALVNLKNSNGHCALTSAILNEHHEAICALLEAKADVNIAGNNGNTPLMYAAQHMPSIIPLLVEKGAQIEIKNNIGSTALLIAILAKQEEAVYSLLKIGADANVTDNNGNTPLMYAIAYMPSSIQLLLERGPELETKNDLNNTALRVAVEYKNSEATNLLLKAGANIYAIGDKGISVLEAAQQSESEEIMNLFAPYV